MDMNPEIRAQWVQALRSGEYTQAEGYLNVPGEGFCCLGVLCELAVKAGVVQPYDTDGDDIPVVGYVDPAGNGSDRVLPPAVVQWAGLDEGTTDPRVFVSATADAPEGGLRNLTVLNDNYEWSFAQIADAIEADAKVQS